VAQHPKSAHPFVIISTIVAFMFYVNSCNGWLRKTWHIVNVYMTGVFCCCSERFQLLIDINNVVTQACSVAAAKSVLTYTDHLKTLQGLEEITEQECTSGNQSMDGNVNNKLIHRAMNSNILKIFID